MLIVDTFHVSVLIDESTNHSLRLQLVGRVMEHTVFGLLDDRLSKQKCSDIILCQLRPVVRLIICIHIYIHLPHPISHLIRGIFNKW